MTKQIMQSLSPLAARKIAAAVGRSEKTVRSAASEGVFPAAWYAAIRALCDAEGVECPESSFSFVEAAE